MHRLQPLLTQPGEKAGTDLPWLCFLRGRDPEERPVAYLPSSSRVGRDCASAERSVTGSRLLATSPTRARPVSGQPDSDGMGGTGRGDLRGRRDRSRRVGPFPLSRGGGVARAQVKPTPTYPGNFRCRGSLLEAGVAQGRPGSRLLPPTWGCVPGLSPGASSLGTRRPLGALRGCKPRQPPRLMEVGGAAPSAGDTRQAKVSAGRGERREGETQTPWDQGTTRRRWPGS